MVGKTLGFRHSHIDDTTNAVIKLGQENGFTVDVWDDRQPGRSALTSTPFTSAESLGQYATILFASNVDGTNNQDPARPRTLNDAELAAFQGYIHDGGGFVGLHAATDAMHAVPWYSELTGGSARFRNHPAQQTATMRVESPTHPSTEMLPKEWIRFDEWYNFTSNPREDVHVLLTLDESTYNPGSGSMGADHPIAWCHNFEGGRSWYEGAGHVDAAYTDPTVPRPPARRHRVDRRCGRGWRRLRDLQGGQRHQRHRRRRGQHPRGQAERRRRGLPCRRGDRARRRPSRRSRSHPEAGQGQGARPPGRTSWSPRSPTSSSGRKASSASDRHRSTTSTTQLSHRPGRDLMTPRGASGSGPGRRRVIGERLWRNL